jgi:hypothetical protein
MNLPLTTSQPVTLYASLRTAWGYTRHELLYVMWALMDTALFTPLALSLMVWARYWPPGQVALWLLLAMLLPFNLGRLMALLSVDKDRQRTVMAIGLLLLVVWGWRTLLYQSQSLLDFRWLGEFFSHVADIGNPLWARDMSLFIVTVVAWWRGLTMLNRELSIHQTGLRLRVGGLMLAPMVIWFGHTQLTWQVTPFLFLFFLAGLTAVSLIRIEQLERSRSQRATPFTPGWLGSILLVGGLIMATAALLVTVLTGNTAGAIWGWLSPVWLALLFGGAVVGGALGYLAWPLLTLLGRIMEFLVGILSRLWLNAQPLLDEFGRRLEELRPEFLDETVEEVVEVTGPTLSGKVSSLLIMVAIILLVSLVLARLYQQATLATNQGEPVGHMGRPGAPRGSLTQRLWQQLGFLRQWRTAASIRAIYQQMCRAAAGAGYPRAESETPYEYLRTLAQAWPDHTADTGLITQAYVRVRYGELPETEAELEELRQAWRRLEETEPSVGSEATQGTAVSQISR